MSAFSKINLVITIGLILTPRLVVAEVKSSPDLSSWISAWKKSPANPDVPKTLALIDRWQNQGTDKASPHFGGLEPKACETWTYLQCEGHGSLNFAVSINTATPGTFKDVKALRRLIQPDIFVLPADNAWQLQLRGKQEIVQLKWTPDSEETFVKGLTESITKTLGYDGIVLAQKDNFLLVGSTTGMLEKDDLQGLVLGGSEKSAAITDNSFTGSALISKISQQYGFGLFSLLAASSAQNIAPGTKIILERKRIAKAQKALPSKDSPAASDKPAVTAPKL